MGGKKPDGSGWVPPGAGRKKGSKNKRTIQLEKIIADQAAKLEVLENKPFEGDAHALLQLAYKDIGLPMSDRLEAAKAAIRFEKPALSSEDRTIKGELGMYRAIPVAERDAVAIAHVAQELIDD
jgi:hypothetical protein